MSKRLIWLVAAIAICLCSSCAPLPAAPCENHSEYITEQVVIPPYENTERELASLDNIEYKRPDTAAIIAEAEALSALIKEGNTPYEIIVEKIIAIDKSFADYSTMMTYAMVKNSENAADAFFGAEYELLRHDSAKTSSALRDLLVAAANSEFAEQLEKDVFGEGFVEKYADASSYTDLAVSLLEQEAALETKYSSLSTANVEITYDNITATLDDTLERLRGEYGESSAEYEAAYNECMRLYESALQDISCDIFVSLLEVRYRLARELGYDSYSEYAYEIQRYDYTGEDMSHLLADISSNVVPVYSALSSRVFLGYFNKNKEPRAHEGKIINDIYKAVSVEYPEIAEAYSYMLNCGLYDISPSKQNRLNGAFTTYIYGIDSPYLFVTTGGGVSDYMMISHEFGHFYDGYINYNSSAPLDLMEVSSSAMEMLVMTKLSDSLCDDNYKYLYYEQMNSILETLIFQGFHAKFEELVYDIPLSSISRESIDAAVVEAARYMHLNTEYINSLDDILILHLVEMPFYVQSYCISSITALDIFFLECETAGEGFDAYLALLDREGNESFDEQLKKANLPSPLRKWAASDISNKIYYYITGSYFYTNQSKNNAA